MLQTLWNTVLYKPFVNLFAFLASIVPGGDIGVAIILLTLLVKIVLYPLSQRGIESQARMNLLAPELNKIKASGASKEEQAKQTFALYKKHKANPLSGCLLVLVQIPIIFALYYVFLKGIKFDGGVLYSFVPAPENVNMNFLGLIDISGKSLFLAILAGLSQYFQAYFMPTPTPSSSAPGSFQESFGKSMSLQMKYIFPIVVAFISYSISGAIALYWVTSNIFAIGQQIYASKKDKHLLAD
ncbi:hypothetical protein A3I95_00440 [Candidatus Nomurabacteria bacterium RIFCSPLOWO2_02_FULL_44_12]|uniref:Membrane insertase YidC/Oxa/ALB C-terminal domain-containing protein n=1 Tax=Candidatus Nomurabacteria bacterium RIFCSPLOWO2_12_FULL_44_11 TaxID=1801796 RepID=A0A1F6Y6L1_9BACT|nr:MAG: hypothetical protein A3E95_02760 [Candidatus Nomurabacteria bacterium RIFCSPHIGHO2_12_FULL_44_22b]OGJ02004.1 MAG: hypothetical protein A3G53_01835 [Candidatus Nomurabacteria bacterium RIFCSPLOWO2_12_FULL_44_11]OGJ08740.1 MAG: hypothetical protein A3I95_00440 [Candidatus Nomurabacteria bacterium RIFCSPLOWO2_02_FULL_44_12]